MAYELTGKIKLIQEPQSFSSGFTKREIVVTVEEGKYPQEISFEFLKDKVSLLDSLSAGQTVRVSFDIRGREYNGRYFNNLVGWRIEPSEGDSTPDDPSAADEKPPLPDDSQMPDEIEDDLPF
ncbi:MAG: DUF3127 domain-containing protein [Verrucomicrobia bacterium]|nr:DUF3127 domain-containing protein [Verrucomicrobiota bacterium]